jgi:hypothetical protein
LYLAGAFLIIVSVLYPGALLIIIALLCHAEALMIITCYIPGRGTSTTYTVTVLYLARTILIQFFLYLAETLLIIYTVTVLYLAEALLIIITVLYLVEALLITYTVTVLYPPCKDIPELYLAEALLCCDNLCCNCFEPGWSQGHL